MCGEYLIFDCTIYLLEKPSMIANVSLLSKNSDAMIDLLKASIIKELEVLNSFMHPHRGRAIITGLL